LQINHLRRENRRHASRIGEVGLEAHDVRTRHAGKLTFIEFHLVVPGEMPVNQAHDICDRIEAALRGDDEHSWVTIHVEPESKAKHSGVLSF
jgi:divalent metal cation (Fe/Co/Zn/Cd) transporter